jgi:hypothetical protein
MTTTNVFLAGRRIATVPALPKIAGYEWLTVPALRHLLFQAASRRDSRGHVISGNGLEEKGAILRIGRKILIDLDRFDAWLDTHRASAEFRGESVR